MRNCGNDACVTYGAAAHRRVLRFVHIAQVILAALMLLLGTAAIVLIANTIRLSIFSRRREIEVMKLVGATNWFVRLPFMLEGMLTGLAASASVRWCWASATSRWATTARTSRACGASIRACRLDAGLTLAAFGLLLGAFGSGMTLRRFLKV